tara:strand:+ start:57 stop:482 length:426 start_codon:yes stop_codon:yes gene_type:complete
MCAKITFVDIVTEISVAFEAVLTFTIVSADIVDADGVSTALVAARRALIQVLAIDSISGVTAIACAIEAATIIGAMGIWMAVVQSEYTFVNIFAGQDSITLVTRCALAFVASRCVDTECLGKACVFTSGTFIDLVALEASR